MTPDVLIVREEKGYRILFGYLHLAGKLLTSSEFYVQDRDEGLLKVMKTSHGLYIDKNGQSIPVLQG